VSRWTGSWLSVSSASVEDPPRWRGERLGLPESGPGSVAGFGRRFGAIVVDWLPCSVLAQLLTSNPGLSALALFALLTTVSVTAFGRTPGHAAVGLRVVMLDGSRAGFGPAVIRTVLICLAVPPLITNADGRGLHDRAANTIVLRTR
jgi:uncharacterized RDD family membrane protein YckC